MMTLFDTTPSFLIAFTNTLIHSLWIAAIIFLFVKGILLSISEQRSALRYRVSNMGLVLFVISITALFTYLYSPSSSTTVLASQNDLDPLYLFSLSSNRTAGELTTMGGLYPLLLKIYVLGLLVLSVRWIISAIQIKMIIRKGTQPGESSGDLLNVLKAKLGIQKNVRIILSEKLKAPVLYGFFKPVIIVPTGMFFNLPHEQVESILMHELIHVKRLDFVINLLQIILEVLFFFNPFTWLLSRQIRSEREKYCDDFVVDSGLSPRVYAKALLNLSLLSSDRYDLAVSATGNNRNILLKRIQRLLNTETMKTRNRQKVMLTYLLIVSFIVIIVSSGFSRSMFTIQKYAKNETIAPSPDLSENTDMNLLFVPDTIVEAEDVVEMTEEEWQEYKKQLKEDIKAIDKEKIQQEMFEAQIHLDSIMENFDMEKIKVELAQAREEIELSLQESLQTLEDLDIDQIRENVTVALEDIDLDFDFDFDFEQDFNINFDSIMKEAKIAIQEINFEEIKQNIEEAMQEMELEMQDMEERRAEAKSKKEEK